MTNARRLLASATKKKRALDADKMLVGPLLETSTRKLKMSTMQSMLVLAPIHKSLICN